MSCVVNTTVDQVYKACHKDDAEAYDTYLAYITGEPLKDTGGREGKEGGGVKAYIKAQKVHEEEKKRRKKQYDVCCVCFMCFMLCCCVLCSVCCVLCARCDVCCMCCVWYCMLIQV